MLEGVFQLLDGFSTIRNIVLLAGLWYLLKTVVWLITLLWSAAKAYLLTSLFPWLYRVNLKTYEWAVVTGASDGIGKGYVLQLARCGVNVVLVSRSIDKLKSVEKEILDQYDVMVKIVVVDFAAGPGIYDNIRRQLSGLEIGILINNVGVTYEFPNYFVDVPENRLWQLINVNMASAVMMTKMILPDMVNRNCIQVNLKSMQFYQLPMHWKKGIIVNMSSMCALIPMPLLAVYSATKIFMDYFTTALRYEYSHDGIIIQNILPCYVATRMTGIKQPSYFAPSPSDYACDALATIGIQDITYGTLAHAIQTFIMLLLPKWYFQFTVFSHLNSTRKRSIYKRQHNKQPHSN